MFAVVMSNSEPLMTTDQVAALAQVHRETVHRWAREGRIPVVTLPNGRRRFRRADVDAVLASSTVTEATA